MTSFPLGRLGSQLKINYFLSFSHAWLSFSLQSDGYVHSELMVEYLNGGVVNDEDLPPIVTLPCPIQVFSKVFTIFLCFYALYIHFSLLLPIYSYITCTLDHKAKYPTLTHFVNKI